MRDLGWESFTFDWAVNNDLAVYALVHRGDLAVLRASSWR